MKNNKFTLIALVILFLLILWISASLLCQKIFLSKQICLPLVCGEEAKIVYSANGTSPDNEPILFGNEVQECRSIFSVSG